MVRIENIPLWNKFSVDYSRSFEGNSFEQELYINYPEQFLNDLFNSYYSDKIITDIKYTFYFIKGSFRYCVPFTGISDNTRFFIKEITYSDINNDEISETLDNINIYYDVKYDCNATCGLPARCNASFKDSTEGGKWGKPTIETGSQIIKKINIGFFGRGDQDIKNYDLRFDINYKIDVNNCSLSQLFNIRNCDSFKQYCVVSSDEIVFNSVYSNLFIRDREQVSFTYSNFDVETNNNIKIYIDDINDDVTKNMSSLILKRDEKILFYTGASFGEIIKNDDFTYDSNKKVFSIKRISFPSNTLKFPEIRVGDTISILDQDFIEIQNIKIIKNKEIPLVYNDSCQKVLDVNNKGDPSQYAVKIKNYCSKFENLGQVAEASDIDKEICGCYLKQEIYNDFEKEISKLFTEQQYENFIKPYDIKCMFLYCGLRNKYRDISNCPNLCIQGVNIDNQGKIGGNVVIKQSCYGDNIRDSIKMFFEKYKIPIIAGVSFIILLFIVIIVIIIISKSKKK